MKTSGKCPYCESDDIEYGALDFDNDITFVFYPCKCNKCGKEFNEGYTLEYTGMYNEDMDEIE